MGNKQMDLTIKKRVTITVAVPVIVICLVLTLYLLREQTTQVESHLKELGEQITKDIAHMSEFALVSGNRSDLNAKLNQLIVGSEIQSIKIVNKHRQDFLGINNPYFPQQTASDLLGFEAPVYLTLEKVNTFDVLDDLNVSDDNQTTSTSGQKVIGYVMVNISVQTLKEQQRSSILAGILLAAVTLAISLMIGNRLGKSIVNPIGQIVATVHKLRSGKYASRVAIERQDEIGKLAADIDQLAVELEHSKSRVNKQMLELTEAREKADRDSAAKSRFLALMSHELRDPLNAVSANLQALEDTKIDDYQRPFLDVSMLSLKQLLQLIQSIMDISMAEAGKLAINPCFFDINDIVDNVVSLYQPAADKKKINLVSSCHIPDDLQHCRLYSDPVRIQQVIGNILGNAVKFTHEGSVFLGVDLLTQSANQVKLKIEIRDTGIGIPEDALDKIFELFEQVQAPSYRREGGAGLGLAISKLITTALGGRLSVESQQLRGSTFTFEVDVAYSIEATASTAPTERKEALQKVDTSKRVLLVEDNLGNQQAVKGLMANIGVDIDVASNGIEGLDKFRANYYDLVYLDLFMPGMDGFEFAKKIRELEKNSSTGRKAFIVAVTAWAQNEVREKCFAAGMDDIIVKPFSKFELYDRFKKLADAEQQVQAVLQATSTKE